MQKRYILPILGILSLLFLTSCDEVIKDVELSFTLNNQSRLTIYRANMTAHNRLDIGKDFIKITDSSTHLDHDEARIYKVKIKRDLRYEYDIKVYAVTSIEPIKTFTQVELTKNKKPYLTID